MTQTILVTGASGFVAAHVLNEFLDAGYNVRAAVRSEKSADQVRKSHGKYGDALSFTYVTDIAAPGAFDEAVKGVDGVIHTASPFILEAKDYDKELFTPAKNGTLSLLQAVKKHNPSVKRIVITSSFAAVVDSSKGTRPGYTYTESDWNPMSVEEARKSDGSNAYLVSKALAEHAAWDFVEKEKPNFSITSLNPPMVYGPIEHSVNSMDHLNTSSADIYRLFNGSTKEVPDTHFWAYADVRDLGKAHILAYESSEAANQRFLITNAAFSYQLFCNIIRDKFPDLRDTTPVGDAEHPSSRPVPSEQRQISKDLGIKYRPMEETVVDAVKSLRELQKTLG